MSDEFETLDSTMRGVWDVTTRGSTHIWDLDSMTYTRHPGPASGSGSMQFDGYAMPITRVEAWPRVGESFVVWYDDPEDPDLLEHYRISSRVRTIKPSAGQSDSCLDPTSMNPRSEPGPHDEAGAS